MTVDGAIRALATKVNNAIQGGVSGSFIKYTYTGNLSVSTSSVTKGQIRSFTRTLTIGFKPKCAFMIQNVHRNIDVSTSARFGTYKYSTRTSSQMNAENIPNIIWFDSSEGAKLLVGSYSDSTLQTMNFVSATENGLFLETHISNVSLTTTTGTYDEYIGMNRLNIRYDLYVMK